ncbi:Heat shock protein [Thalictrum thalictroides]|uniref:Heat shock protein n=1 Tax=Thalictrum thalictroides TaxID=46969 RepID=A0A7J6WN31_THATH|nr:Heat shock protein [Thalictrum thalictroides]
MASSIILKSASGRSSGLLPKFCYPLRFSAVDPSSRAFNTSAMEESSGDDEQPPSHVDCRRVSPFGAVVYDPFTPPRTITLGKFLDYLAEKPAVDKSGGLSNVSSRGMVSKADNDAVYLKFDMPGVGKEDVKVTFEQDFLMIKAERANDDGFGESGSRYNSRVRLETERFKIDEIKAEMKNGVLKVVIPKLKEEERKDVFQVKAFWLSKWMFYDIDFQVWIMNGSKLSQLPPSPDIMKLLIEKKKKEKSEEELTTLTSIAVCFKDALNIKI